MPIDKFQQKQLDKLRSYKEGSYEDASIYTVLLDLVEGNSIEDVFAMLCDVAKDTDREKWLKKAIKTYAPK